jgi:hypothetical protein
MQGRVWGVLTCILTVVCAGGFVSDGEFGQCAIRLRGGAVRRQGCGFRTCQGRRPGLVRPFFWVPVRAGLDVQNGGVHIAHVGCRFARDWGGGSFGGFAIGFGEDEDVSR